MIKYTIINSAVNSSDQKQPDMSVLKVIHNAGFFSNNTIALMDIIHFFNQNKGLPDEVDRVEQYVNYKYRAGHNLIPDYFKEDDDIDVLFDKSVPMDYDCMSIQFAPYSKLPFKDWKPFIDKYFLPSDHVGFKVDDLQKKYNLDYENLCAVFYRGNDKVKEMSVASYESFIDKAIQVKMNNPNVRFLVQPDETDFLTAFMKVFPDSIYFTETPSIQNKDEAVFMTIPRQRLADYGATFFAALICLSRCKHVITHSGNCGLWTCLYRGDAKNVYQIFEEKWLN